MLFDRQTPLLREDNNVLSVFGENRIDQHLCETDEITRSSSELFDVFEDLSSS
jgi:hypothetical protein